MNLSSEGISAMAAYINDWAPDNAAIAALLNAQVIVNPTPQGTILRPIYSAEVMGMLSPDSLQKVSRNAGFTQIRDDIKNQRRTECVEWVFFVQSCGDITQSEATNIVNYLMSTVPDPHWQENVSWSHVNLGRAVDVEDVGLARELAESGSLGGGA